MLQYLALESVIVQPIEEACIPYKEKIEPCWNVLLFEAEQRNTPDQMVDFFSTKWWEM